MSDDYAPIYQAAGEQHQVDPDLLRAIGDQESEQDRFAVSPAGAEGVMQLMPATARELGVHNSFVPEQNIHGGARYFRQMLDRFDNDPYQALGAYNAGPNGDFSNPETSNYIHRVADRWDAYRQQRLNRSTPQAAPADEWISPPVDEWLTPPGPAMAARDTPAAQETATPPSENKAQPAPPAPAEEHVPGQGMLGATANAVRRGVVEGVAGAVEGAGDIYRRVTGAPPTSSNAAIDWGKDYKQRAAESYPIDAANKGFVTNVAGGVGGMLPMVGAATAAGAAAAPLGVAGAAGALTTMAVVGSQSYAATHNEALAKGATPQAADQAASLSALTQAGIMALPIGRVLHEVPALASGLWSTLEGMAKRGVEFAGFNSVARVADNYVAQNTFDPDRHLLDGVPEAAAEGAATGPLVHLPQAAGAGREATKPPVPQPTAAAPGATLPTPHLPQNYMPDTGQPPPATGTVNPTPAPVNPATAPPAQNAPAPVPQPLVAAPPPPAQTPPAPAHSPLDALEIITEGGDPKNVPPSAPPAPPPEPVNPVVNPAVDSVKPAGEIPPQAPVNPPIETVNPPVEAAPPAPPHAEAASVESTQAAPPPPPTSGGYTLLDPADLKVDPKRFQYKEADPEKGVTGALAGTDKWEPALANPITVWQDESGQMFVVNGHQRTDLAMRAQAAGQPDVQMPARIYRAADGYTPEYMRTLGAYQNIAEGSGTAIDAAKIMRGAKALPDAVRLPDLPPRGQLVRDATGLTKLSDDAFGAVVNGAVEPAYAAHVGNLISDPTEQVSALQMLAGADPKNSSQARILVEDMRNSGFLRDTQTSLFGDEAFSRSLLPERARILDGAMQTLGRNKTVFGAAVRGEDTLAAAGNTLDRAKNVKAQSDNAELLDSLQRNATLKGPLSDALTQAATALAAGQPRAAVISQFLGRARDLVRTGEAARVQHSDPDSGGGSPRDGEPPGATADTEHPPEQQVEGQDALFAPRKGKINVPGQDDLFAADNPRQSSDTAAKTTPSQTEMFPRNDAAQQAQAARDARGTTPDVEQKAADHGLFAQRAEGQGDIERAPFRIARSQLGEFALWDARTNKSVAGRDLTNEVVQHPDVPGQVTGARFVVDRGAATGHEYLTAVDHASGVVIHAATNDLPGGVGFAGSALRGLPDDSLTVHHNHPRGMGFSPQDMAMLYAPAMGRMVAHSQGDVFIASIGARASGQRSYDNNAVATQMMARHAAMERVTKPILQSLVNDHYSHGRDAAADAALVEGANKSYFDVVARLLHAEGLIDYVSTRAMHPQVKAALADYLTRQGFTATEIAAAVKTHTVDEAMATLPRADPKGLREDAPDVRSPEPVRPGGGAESVPEGDAGGQRPERTPSGGVRAAEPEGAAVRSGVMGEGFSSGTGPDLVPQGRLDRFLSRARDLYETARSATNQHMTDLISPLAGGSARAMAIAQRFANALRGVTLQFKLVDDHLRQTFKPEERVAMGRAMDEQSVLEQEIRSMRDANAANAQGELGETGQPAMSAAELDAAEQRMRQQWTADGKGIEVLPAAQRAVVEQLAKLADQVWGRMQARGLVDASARGLPYYFARTVLQKDALGNTVRAGKAGAAGGRDISGIGSNLSTAGPLHRKYLTPEETLANARVAVGDPKAFLLQDIRGVASALARNERSIAGKDMIDAIKRIGVATGNNTVLHGEIPTGVNPADYFTINHPSFQQYTGNGFQAIHVAREFEGPLNAVLTRPSGGVYNAVMKAKGTSMSAIMWSPLMHLNVELGRAFPLMKGKLLSAKFWQDGARLGRDGGYMQQATQDGLAPIGQSWRGDPATLFDESDVNRAAPGPIGQALEKWHDFHQKVLWDTVYKLQVGIYDSMRTKMMNEGFDPRTAGIMAAHFANRYAGALPAENLRKGANQVANLFLFSRSFTLGNLGVMKDMLNGMPRQTVAMIQQEAGTDAANRAVSVARRKAVSAVVLDVGLAVVANQVIQEGIAAVQRAGTMGVVPAVQSVFDDWLTQAKGALQKTATTYNPLDLLGVLPTFNNEPHKTNRALLGRDDQGRGIYARLALGKVGEEFMGWPTTPAEMLFNKMSPWTRPLMDDLEGADTLGRKLYDPNASWFSKLGASVMHVMNSLGPVDQVKGASELVKQMVGQGDKTADPWVQAFRTFVPATGLATISSGFPGGPEAGRIYSEKQSQQFQQQQALPEARKLVQNGDIEGAVQRLRDAGMQSQEITRLIKGMNPASMARSQQRWAGRHETEDQQRDRRLINTGRPLDATP